MNKILEFLRKIREIESSGGTDTEHRTMASGIHKDQRAIGDYGLMPNTVKEIENRAKESETRGLDKAAHLTPDEMKKYMELNPPLQEEAAQRLAEHVLNKQNGDEDKAAYSWLYGHNLSPEKIEQRKYLEDPYVKKFQALKQPEEIQENNLKEENSEEIEKKFPGLFKMWRR